MTLDNNYFVLFLRLLLFLITVVCLIIYMHVAIGGGQRPACRPSGDEAQQCCSVAILPAQRLSSGMLVSGPTCLTSWFLELVNVLFLFSMVCITAVRGAFSSLLTMLGMKQILNVE